MTFSAFSMDVINIIHESELIYRLGYAILRAMLSLLSLSLFTALGRFVLK